MRVGLSPNSTRRTPFPASPNAPVKGMPTVRGRRRPPFDRACKAVAPPPPSALVILTKGKDLSAPANHRAPPVDTILNLRRVSFIGNGRDVSARARTKRGLVDGPRSFTPGGAQEDECCGVGRSPLTLLRARKLGGGTRRCKRTILSC